MIPELKTLLIAMAPIGELRVAIPIALTVYKLNFWSAFIWAFIGNIFVIIPLLWALNFLTNNRIAGRIPILNKFLSWLFQRTRKRHSQKIERWRDLALMIFVAIPLPGTGAWTGALIAFVFGIPLKRAFPLISLGVLIAGIIVSLITLGIINLPSI